MQIATSSYSSLAVDAGTNLALDYLGPAFSLATAVMPSALPIRMPDNDTGREISRIALKALVQSELKRNMTEMFQET